MKKVVAIVLIAIQIMNFSCESTEPVRIDEGIKLTAIDAAVFETYLNVNIDNPSVNKELVIERNGSRVISLPATSQEIAVTDTGLLENTTYNYSAKLYEGEKLAAESSEISITTLKPSSHDFVWETFTFGEHSSSGLYDVAIIDENNIWAVGEIYLKDSTGQINPHAYNAVHWNGNTWEFKQILFYTICGQHNKTAYPARSIISIENGVWITSGDQVTRLEGNLQKELICLPFSFLINKIWGITSSDLYIVGNGGNIARYDGKNWEKIEIGTDWTVYDVFGYTNPLNNSQEILCATTDDNNYASSTIIRIKGKNKVEKINLNTHRLTGSVWTNKGFPIYTTGDGIFSNKNGRWEEIKLPVNYVTSKIRGNGLNDMILCGGLGLIAHNNGRDWKIYSEVYNAVYTSINIKNNVAVAVGWRDGKAVISIGKRN